MLEFSKIVNVTDEAGAEQWRGTLAKWVGDNLNNGADSDEIADSIDALRQQGFYRFGGGAAPIFELRFVEA